MALTLKLPERANKVTFDDNEVLDIRLTLLNPEFPKGEGVVVAQDLDTEPKARVRCRNMVELLGNAQTVTSDVIPAEFWEDEENLLEWLSYYEDDHGEDADTDPTDVPTYTFPAVKVRTHTVDTGSGKFAALLSLKP